MIIARGVPNLYDKVEVFFSIVGRLAQAIPYPRSDKGSEWVPWQGARRGLRARMPQTPSAIPNPLKRLVLLTHGDGEARWS
jgi:hypothetical protein